MNEVMNHIAMIADDYRRLSDQLNYNIADTYNELESKQEMSQEQILSMAIDETDNIMFQVEDSNGPDFEFTEEEIEQIENLIVQSSLDKGILIEQIKNIKSKQQEVENWLNHKKYRMKVRDEKFHFENRKK